ncbi:hypothetical protein JB92DRAFT_2711512 [Gautieria morchelliformis]|nr:hypothetical protein JB92DRAFT_2711512 [Gautieria morchelliformis]
MSSDYNVTLVVPRPSSGQNPHNPILAHSTIPKSLPPCHIVIRVDRFGFSSNNITYQALGEEPHFRYFEFHPAPDAPDVHGVIPVWGFGTVVASNVSKIPVNERVFGYLAMARYLLLPVDTSNINQFNFYVPRPHLPPDRRPYNQITRCSRDKLYHPAEEDLSMLYRPLFWTSFWAEDWLFTGPKKPYNGASTILISSASSKTAFCLAYLVQKRSYHSLKVMGLTSKGNLAFTKGLGLYHTVFTYDEVEAYAGKSDGTWIYVDVAGNDALNSRIWNKLGSRVVRNISLGLTNLSPSVQSTYAMPVSGVTNSSTLKPGTASSPVEFFFMPEWLAERRHTLTASDISKMQYTAWGALMRDCKAWVALERTWGPEEVRRGYLEMVKGRVGPDKGLIWSLWDEPDGLLWERELLRRGSVSGKF